MSSIKSRAADALAPMLASFHSANGESLQAVWYVHSDASLESVVLEFGETSLAIAADENDDTVDLTIVQTNRRDTRSASGNHLDIWKQFIGKRFGWGWITVNQQGYCDGLLLSFEGVVPQLAISVVASSIKVATISAFA